MPDENGLSDLQVGHKVRLLDVYGKPMNAEYEIIFVDEGQDRWYIELKK